ncbi:MAG: hypothetical protein ACC612_01880 [Methanomethylovorans sp.]|uniref:hypothetical protein n=1 Tax=Methanomethylovorans sp. TaxID=2758717 RepID=UPI0035312751
MRADDDSAQLLLIAGFAIGVGIVVFTVMLNNVIYASNMASDSSTETSSYEMGNVLALTSQAYEDAYTSAISSGTFDNNAFQAYLSSYQSEVSKSFALSGTSLEIENSSLINAHFSKNGMVDGVANWTLIRNVNLTNSFVIEIPDASTLDDVSSCLRIEAVETGGNLLWAMDVYDSEGNVNVSVMDSNSTLGTVSSSGYLNVFLNVTGNSIDGSDFNFHFNDLTSSHEYQINVINGAAGEGTLTVSGNLADSQPFTIARHSVVLANITIASADKEMFVSYPVPVPGGSA